MTEEKLRNANKLKDEIEKAKYNIRLLKEQAVIALITDHGMGKIENRLSDVGVRDVLIRHYTESLEMLEKEFEKI